LQTPLEQKSQALDPEASLAAQSKSIQSCGAQSSNLVERGERLQKKLAACGLGSRREIERWMEAGRIRVNGQIARPGLRLSADDHVELDHVPLTLQRNARRRLLLYHKPVGQICSRDDPQGRPTIYATLPTLRGARWISIGRLDFNTSGLLLLTTDGQLANRLMHPSSQVEREYLCRVRGRVTREVIEELRQGILLDGQLARFCSVRRTREGNRQASNQWFQVILREGRYREVRRMWQQVGCTVSRLIRIRYGSWVLPKTLVAGHFQELDAAALDKLNMPGFVSEH